MDVEVLGGRLAIDESRIATSDDEIRKQVRAYGRGTRQQFDLPVTIPDSFTGEVMRAIAEIPFGETRTYGTIAVDLETAPVAVGGGCARNPVPLVIPCHRVVAADGSLGGYSAPGGLPLKRRLLAHERRVAGDE